MIFKCKREFFCHSQRKLSHILPKLFNVVLLNKSIINHIIYANHKMETECIVSKITALTGELHGTLRCVIECVISDACARRMIVPTR